LIRRGIKGTEKTSNRRFKYKIIEGKKERIEKING
jgi:hypothetical protein